MDNKKMTWDTERELEYLQDIGSSASTNKHILSISRNDLIRRYMRGLVKRERGNLDLRFIIAKAREMV